VLCTPAGVDRIYPVARHFQGPPTKRCDEVPPMSPSPLRLQVVDEPSRGLQVTPGP
jgi:hypothetical protein